MTPGLPQVAELVRRETGIVIGEAQLPGLAAALDRVEPGIEPERFLAEVRGHEATSGLLRRLVDEVTNQESYFFRELRDLHAIDWFGLAASAREGGSDKVRIWVSACAAGEEAYTLAILASEAFGPAPPPLDILGTDISGAALRSAQQARYSANRLRNLPSSLRDRYFTHEGGGYEVRDTVKSLVRFRRHNLVRDPLPPTGEGPFQVVACRNVLIYFDPMTVERVIGALESTVDEAGQLILGVADRLPGTTGRLDRLPLERRRERSIPRGDLAPARAPERAQQSRREEDRIEDALRAADAGDLKAAIEIASTVLNRDPLDADAYFVRGLAELGRGDGPRAVGSFRRALYVDPTFGLAAFKLGRAQDSCGDGAAARLAYERALRELDPKDDRHRAILDQVDLNDVAAACRARLGSGAATPG